MKKSNLVSILKTFDKKEVREFKKWLKSPAHNQRQDVIDLFQYLVTGRHLSSDKFLDKKRIFSALFGSREYDDAEMRQTMYFLFKAVESFLVYDELLKDRVRSRTILAKVYRQRQLPKLFKKTMDAGQKMQEKQPLRNHQYYEHEFALQFEQYTYLSGLGRNVPNNLQKVSDASDKAYLANKLQLSCFMIAHQAVFKADYDMGMLQEVLGYIATNNSLLEIPAIAVYYFGFKAIKEKNSEDNYQKLKEQIRKYSDLFPADEIRVIYLLAINYCIGQINAGKLNYYNESFELYALGIKKNIFLENGVMSRFTYSNAIINALNLNEFEWVENFIAGYSQFLEEKHRESYVLFYRARLHFERGQYDKAMPLFAQYDTDDTLMSLLAKTMLLKMYYELDEYNALDSLLDSMRAYIQRKKVMGYHKSVFKNLLKYSRKLLKIMPNDAAQIQKLKTEIENADPIMERKWLLEQLDKM
ncbi:MAG TPA: hypothetical protein ENJ95_21745 [Bacteroidetes bacterium]|nr:hypothetical protein [Bacteroidota bacterium]